jgi:branched-chain amino acid transport system ATP-binding protein
MSAVLEGEDLRKTYGGLVAVDDVSLTIDEGEIRGLIGPNGAGKTTLLNLLTRVEDPDSGVVRLDGREITTLSVQEVCHRGLVKTNQTVRPLADFTVLENVAVAAVYGSDNVDTMAEARSVAMDWLEFVGLEEFADRSGRKLTHTTARRLEVARALATEPRVLLLDEAAAGLSSEELHEFMSVIERIREDLDITVLWIEHVMEAIMGVADRVTVIHFGEKIAEGNPREIMNNEQVQEAYLGGEA